LRIAADTGRQPKCENKARQWFPAGRRNQLHRLTSPVIAWDAVSPDITRSAFRGSSFDSALAT
jgi:hypothetical protein